MLDGPEPPLAPPPFTALEAILVLVLHGLEDVIFYIRRKLFQSGVLVTAAAQLRAGDTLGKQKEGLSVWDF